GVPRGHERRPAPAFEGRRGAGRRGRGATPLLRGHHARTAAALHELLADVLRPERAAAAPDLALPRRPPTRALGGCRWSYGPRARGQAGSGERRPARRGPRAAP